MKTYKTSSYLLDHFFNTTSCVMKRQSFSLFSVVYFRVLPKLRDDFLRGLQVCYGSQISQSVLALLGIKLLFL